MRGGGPTRYRKSGQISNRSLCGSDLCIVAAAKGARDGPRPLQVAAFLTLPPVTKARPPLLQDSRYTEYPEACDSGPWAAHLAAFARGIASKYFGTMTLVFGEAARISWTKDCKASRLACCEALNGARKLSQ
jgi:hypothetical protein